MSSCPGLGCWRRCGCTLWLGKFSGLLQVEADREENCQIKPAGWSCWGQVSHQATGEDWYKGAPPESSGRLRMQRIAKQSEASPDLMPSGELWSRSHPLDQFWIKSFIGPCNLAASYRKCIKFSYSSTSEIRQQRKNSNKNSYLAMCKKDAVGLSSGGCHALFETGIVKNIHF